LCLAQTAVREQHDRCVLPLISVSLSLSISLRMKQCAAVGVCRER